MRVRCGIAGGLSLFRGLRGVRFGAGDAGGAEPGGAYSCGGRCAAAARIQQKTAPVERRNPHPNATSVEPVAGPLTKAGSARAGDGAAGESGRQMWRRSRCGRGW